MYNGGEGGRSVSQDPWISGGGRTAALFPYLPDHSAARFSSHYSVEC